MCTVAGFPLGATPPEVKAFEAARAVADGACEVDMVLNVGALKSADYRLVERDIARRRRRLPRGGRLSKVIIEAALLTDDEKVKACVLAKAAGADFVKTSTGFGPGGATVADVALMRRVVGPEMGVKAAGGVRDLKQAQAMIEAGADRIGASVGVKIVQESRGAGRGRGRPALGLLIRPGAAAAPCTTRRCATDRGRGRGRTPSGSRAGRPAPAAGPGGPPRCTRGTARRSS